jgi:hypothetical protein
MTRASVTVGAAVALLIADMAGAGQGSRDRERSSLPAAVSQAIQDNRPGAEIDKLDVEREHGIAFYDIEFKADQGEMDVAEDGTVLDIATVIDMKDVPEVVAAAFRTRSKGRTITRIERSEVRAEIVSENGKGRVSKLSTPKYVYEAELTRGEVEVAADGTVIKAP